MSAGRGSGGHEDPAWRVRWVTRGPERGEALVSTSTDGRVTQWATSKARAPAEVVGLRVGSRIAPPEAAHHAHSLHILHLPCTPGWRVERARACCLCMACQARPVGPSWQQCPLPLHTVQKTCSKGDTHSGKKRCALSAGPGADRPDASQARAAGAAHAGRWPGRRPRRRRQRSRARALHQPARRRHVLRLLGAGRARIPRGCDSMLPCRTLRSVLQEVAASVKV